MKKIIGLILIGILTLFNLTAQETDHWETVVYATDVWKYFLGNSDPGPSWNYNLFNDSLWFQGQGGIGNNDNDDNTVIPTVISVFMRIRFNVLDTSKITNVIFHMDYDDGFVSYINGTEIARAGISGNPPAYDVTATNHEAQMYSGENPDQFQIRKSVLINGENLLAIEVHNTSATSSDMSAIAFLTFGIIDTSTSYRPTPEWFKEPLEFKSSNLPIFIIETENSESIPDEPKINAMLKVINHPDDINWITDTIYDYNGLIGIEMRGSYSQTLPQKPYAIETRDNQGENNNVSILGLPAENDWVLLTHYNEKTFARNPLSFHLFNQMGHYASRTRLCEVVVNGSYDGIYLFGEKIKRDNDRVDISKLDNDDNAGDSLTGGYIFKIDYYSDNDSWLGNYSPIDYPGAQIHYVYYDPAADELTSQQKTYIKDYVDIFETVLYGTDYDDIDKGYRKYIDISSFIDYFIIGELSRNVDAYKKSCYYSKDKDNGSKTGLLQAGPVWDFDWAWLYLQDGCEHFGSTDGSGWAYRIDECNPRPTPTGWIVKMMQDERFRDLVYTRYFALRETILSKTYLYHYLDSIALYVDEAKERHYQRWPILGQDVGAAEIGTPPSTYSGEIDWLKEWIDKRLTWLDANMPGKFIEPIENIELTEQFAANVRIFPNPAVNYVFTECDELIKDIEIYSTSGTLLLAEYNINHYICEINLSGLPGGIYILKVITTEDIANTSRLVVKE